MATRLKPSRINVDNTPRVWDGAAYQNDNDFHWSMGGWDMSYEDFEWHTLTGTSLVIEDISNNITPSSNFTVSAGTVKPGIEYVLRVNTGNTAYTMTLGTGVTNPNGYSTELTPNKVNQFKFIATSNSQLELEGVDTSEYLTWLTILSYGNSTWNDFITAYNKNSIVYCRASSNSNPATWAQNRLAFMAYVNNATSPTEVEFQYYRSRSSHGSDANQQDEVYVYKLTNASWWTWTVEVRDTAAKIATWTWLTKAYTTSWSKSTLTIANDGVLTVNGANGTVTVNDIKQSATEPSDKTAWTAWYDTTNWALKVYNWSSWDTIATGWAISDTAYGSGWNGQTTTAPSQNAVYDKIESVEWEISTNTSAISTINWKIPSEATTSNQLADKQYVLNNINSVTAYYITKNAQGDQFATYAELAAATTFYSGWVVRVPTMNDYTIVLSDENHDDATTRYIYNSGWEYQYTINETPLTQAQLNAINSWITAAKVAGYDALNVKAFYLPQTSNLWVAQDIYDWYAAWKNPVVIYGDASYYIYAVTSTTLSFRSIWDIHLENTHTRMTYKQVTITHSSGTVSGVSAGSDYIGVVETDRNYTAPYIPAKPEDPATKKYVDDRDTYIGSSEPTSNKVEWRLWYDTTNDQLKVYDGTNWQVTGKEYTAWDGILIWSISISSRQWPCEEWFHVPSAADWQWVWNIMNAMNPLLVANWGPRKNYLHMPYAWGRDWNSLYGQGSTGAYWSSSKGTEYTSFSCMLLMSNNYFYLNDEDERSWWHSIRAFKNEYVAPDNTWTVVFGTLWNSWIFWNQTEWLITITNGTTGYTMMDKNIGATVVYNDGDTLSEANCGKYFQRWNNYWFPRTWNVTTSNTAVNTVWYGPSNPYSDDTFIVSHEDWSANDNWDLWWDITNSTTIINNVISNTGVLSVNGQTGNVTIEAFQLAPNSPLTPKYRRYWSQAQYDALTQYYTDNPGDTVYFTI